MTCNIELKITDARLHDWGTPRYMTSMSAGIDLYACVDESLVIPAASTPVLISSGIAICIDDPQIAAMILPRSGLGHKKGLVLGNLLGLIDADYTATIMISAWNRSHTESITIEPGDRIAQLIFVPIIQVQFQVVTKFSHTTERGGGGFGSTGVSITR